MLPLSLIVSGASSTAEGDDESPFMPFMENTGAGLNDREDAPGRDSRTTKTMIADTSDLRIIFVDIRFDMGGKQGSRAKEA